MKILYTFVMIVCLPIIADEKTTEKPESDIQPVYFDYANLELTLNPKKRPNYIPSESIPENSRFLKSIDLKGDSFLDLRESVLILGVDLNVAGLEDFYEKTFATFGWRIMQKEKKQGKLVYLAESPARKTISFLVSPVSDTTSRVKIVYKKSDLY